MSWTHVIGAGATEITIGFSTSTGPAVSSVKVGTINATLVDRADINGTGGTDGWCYKYHLANPKSGSQTIAVTMASASDMEGGSISYLRSNGLGTPVIAHNVPTGGAGDNASSVSVPTTSNQSIVDMNTAAGSFFSTATSPATLRWEKNLNSNSAAGCAAAATTPGTGGMGTPTVAHGTDWWGDRCGGPSSGLAATGPNPIMSCFP